MRTVLFQIWNFGRKELWLQSREPLLTGKLNTVYLLVLICSDQLLLISQTLKYFLLNSYLDEVKSSKQAFHFG